MKNITTITLPNGKKVTLHLTYNEYHFLISALSDKGINIGQCKFNIEKIYRERNKTTRAPHIARINVNNQDRFNIQGSTYIQDTGEVFDYVKTITTLMDISITSEDYYKVGLGTAMYKHMEKISRTYNSASIEGFYQPTGKFAIGAKSFYLKNGFTIDESASVPTVKKQLQKTPTILSSKRSSHKIVDPSSTPDM